MGRRPKAAKSESVPGPVSRRRPLHVVRVELPRCPICPAMEKPVLTLYRTQTRADGTKLQYAQCRRCLLRFKILWQ